VPAFGDEDGEHLGLGGVAGGGQLAVAAAAAGSAADGFQRGGEGDPGGIEAVAGGGEDDQGADGLVDGQQGPDFLAGQVGGLAAQGAAGAEEAGLDLEVAGFNRPPLVPLKRKSSLAFRRVSGRY
jgi:hypothetical protein